MDKSVSAPAAPTTSTVDKYTLGDCLGKGAFGQVYRALNFTTGEAVAVKQIQLSNIPKSELGDIMSEIDLLKNLNHANIVKYKGFVKTRDYLYIILEYCENGSLHNILKRFGKFPENLVAVYISQVLEGLVYLHDQGVIHRDIKGANLLTNKDGTVKLADFGVASKSAAVNDNAVVGSPYWMSPEVIEQSGATTASDIWSVGCVVIELLEGKPPYHFLAPMPALFRIVQDDCPPIPEGASPIVKDFLYHCFQKDANLRVSAKKLLKHPWMVSARRNMAPTSTDEKAKDGKPAPKKPAPNYDYDAAVLKVQEWNEKLKSPSRTMKYVGNGNRRIGPARSMSPTPSPTPTYVQNSPTPSETKWKPRATQFGSLQATAPMILPEKLREQPPRLQAPEEETDNWDDDFEEGISLSKLQALEKSTTEEEKQEEKQEPDWNSQTIRPSRTPSTSSMESFGIAKRTVSPVVEDYSDLAIDDDEEAHLLEKVADFKMKNATKKGILHPSDIKTVGISSTNSSPTLTPTSLPSGGSLRLARRPSGPSPIAAPTTSAHPGRSLSHSRSSSLLNKSGSFGRSDFKRSYSQTELERYTEPEDEDYDEIFGKPNGSMSGPMQTLQLNTRLSNKSWPGEDNDNEEDPFAEIDEGFVEDDLETNLNRDKYARLCTNVNQLIDDLVPKAPEFTLRETCDQLINIIADEPEMQMQLVSSHGMLAILEVLESKPSRDVIMKLLQIINLLVTADIGFLESFCLIGGIPVLMGFTSKRYPEDCRVQASTFIRLLCHTSVLTLQMFIACRGLKVLVELLDEDYNAQVDLVDHALNGIASVFELQSPTPKNDFCRMFIREGLLDPLSSALSNIAGSHSAPAEIKAKLVNIVLVFTSVSQSDMHVRSALSTRQITRRLLRACELLDAENLVHMLKAIKHLSMSPVLLDVLQNANAIEILVKILDDHSLGPHGTEISNHIFQTIYHMCRLNKSRQEEAAQAGIIPHLKRILDSNSPLKQFALPVLCDLASAGKSCRMLLWSEGGLKVYVRLLEDPYFQVSALEAILAWLQEETARVEDALLNFTALKAIADAFITAKAASFENLLDPLLKILRISSAIPQGILKNRMIGERFFPRLLDKVKGHSKAVVRLNLLKLLRILLESDAEETGSVAERYGVWHVVDRIARKDGAVLVREVAREILPQGWVRMSASAPPVPRVGDTSISSTTSATSTSTSTQAAAAPPVPAKSGIAPRRTRLPTPSPLLPSSAHSAIDPSPRSPISPLAPSPLVSGKILVPKRRAMRRTSSESSPPSTAGYGVTGAPSPPLPGYRAGAQSPTSAGGHSQQSSLSSLNYSGGESGFGATAADSGSVHLAMKTTGLPGPAAARSPTPGGHTRAGSRQGLRDIPWARSST